MNAESYGPISVGVSDFLLQTSADRKKLCHTPLPCLLRLLKDAWSKSHTRLQSPDHRFLRAHWVTCIN